MNTTTKEHTMNDADIKKLEATVARLEKKLKKPMATLERIGLKMTLDAAKRDLDDMRNNR